MRVQLVGTGLCGLYLAENRGQLASRGAGLDQLVGAVLVAAADTGI